MAQPLIIEIGDLFLVANDVNRALSRLPEDVRRDVAPLVRRMGEWRLATIRDEVAHPTALLIAISQLMELIVDEYGERT
jgi:hypothetical protein